MRKKPFLFAATLVLLLLSACAANQSQDTATKPVDPPTVVIEAQVENNPESVEEKSVEIEPEEISDPQDTQPDSQVVNTESSEEIAATAGDGSASASERPAWQHLALTNARTGESFTLADFEDKTVFVETMATWCSRCRDQLNNVREATYQFNGDEVVFVAISVETTIDDATLANYANGSGYDWLFAVATPDLIRELTEEFGRAIIVPPSTPHFIIQPDGASSELITGIEPAGQIVSQISAAQG